MGGNVLAFADVGPYAIAHAVCWDNGDVLCDFVCAVAGVAQDIQAGLLKPHIVIPTSDAQPMRPVL